MLWKGFQKPKRLAVDTSTLTDKYGIFWAQPFERGFGTTVGNALRRVLFESLPMTAEMRGMWNVWLGFWDRSSHSSKIRQLTKARYEEWMDRIAHLVQGAQAAGELSDMIDPARAAQAVVAMIDGIGVRVLLTGITISPSRQKEMVDDWLSQLPRPALTTASRARRKATANGAGAAAD